MKKVFSNPNDVLHLFAQRTQTDARCSNVFFEDDVAYSYGKHFPLGKFFDRKKYGKVVETVILLNSARYSNTTSKHQSEIKFATRQYKQFTVPCVNFDLKYSNSYHARNSDYYLLQIKELAGKALKANKDYNVKFYLNEYHSQITEYQNYCKFFKLKTQKHFEISDIEIKAKLQKIQERENYNAEHYEEIQAKRLKNQLKKQAEIIDNWINGNSNIRPKTDYQYLRLYAYDNDLVETSMNVRVPLSHALLLLAKIRHCVQTNTEFISNGKTIKIGNFEVSRIEANGNFQSGCHKFEYSEVERFAKSINA